MFVVIFVVKRLFPLYFTGFCFRIPLPLLNIYVNRYLLLSSGFPFIYHVFLTLLYVVAI